MSLEDTRASADSPDAVVTTTRDAVAPDLPEDDDGTGEAITGRLMTVLSRHLPLCLLLDMSSPAGPDSEHLLEAEGEPEDAWWEQAPAATAQATHPAG